MVVSVALATREQLGITAGDFTNIIGYTIKVAAASVVAAPTVASVVRFSRAYHVYATGGRLRPRQ